MSPAASQWRAIVLVGFILVAAATAVPASAQSSGPSPVPAPQFSAEGASASVATAPSITIIENAVPNAPDDFSFTGCQGTGCGPFVLDDDPDSAVPDTVSATLAAGMYTITQAPGPGHWVLDDIFCDTGEDVDVENRTVTITLGATEAVTCTFLNRSPSIRIIEDAEPDAPQDFSFTGCQGAGCAPFVLDDDTDPALSNTVTGSGLAPGTYTITQAPTANWSLRDLSCTAGEVVDLGNRRVTITLDADEFTKCTFTNRTTGIRVVQDSMPDSPQDFGYTSCLDSSCGRFTLDDDGDPALANTVTGAGLAPGTYTITQDITPGFDLLDVTCSGDVSNRRARVYLEQNQTETCTFVNRPTPPPLTNVAQLSAGQDATCARLTSGEVRCWGYNWGGWLGTGSSDQYLSSPAVVLNAAGTGPLTDVVQVSVGGSQACAVLQNGEARCWGYGYLGNGTNTDDPPARPVTVLNPAGSGPLTGVAQIAVGVGGTTCARLSNGEARCWGYNGNGQLGNGTSGSSSLLPVVVSNPDGTGPLTDVAQISTGGSHSCARLSNGEARCWGGNWNGQLGNGTTDRATRPVAVLNSAGTAPLTGIAQVAAGGYKTCARVGRQARCWGGDAGTLPVVVLDPSGEAPLTNVAEITTGSQDSSRWCVRLLNGQARCWGQIPGNGTSGSSSLLPVVVSNPDGTGPLTDVAQISTGGSHSCARLSNGEARCWGGNWNGQLGNGVPNGDIPGRERTRPVVVINP